MMNEATALQNYLIANLNPYITALSTTNYPLTSISESNVPLDLVDLDKYRGSLYFFVIPPTQENRTQISYSCDQVTIPIEVFLVVNGSKDAVILVGLYAEALKKCLSDNQTLGAIIEDLHIDKLERYYYEGKPSCPAIKLDITLTNSENW